MRIFSFCRSLALAGMCGWEGERGRGVPALYASLSGRLFGEFADDADKCSVFILKTLVVCSQINKNL